MKYLAWVLKWLRNRNVILILAFVLGLALGPAVSFTAALTLPALAVIVMASASQIPTRDLLPVRRLVRPTVLAVTFTYLVASPVILVLGRLLIADPELYAGLVLVAAAPSGAVVLPFTAILAGDTNLSLLGTIGVYLSALLVTPLLVEVAAGGGLIQPQQMLIVLGELVVLPLLASRVLRLPPLIRYIDRWRGTVVNWGFFVVILSVVAVNRDVFLRQPRVLALMTVVALLSVFGLGYLVRYVLRWLGVERAEQVSLQLFSSIKNSGFAAATALALVSARAAVPGAVFSVIIVIYLIFLGIEAGRRERR